MKRKYILLAADSFLILVGILFAVIGTIESSGFSIIFGAILIGSGGRLLTGKPLFPSRKVAEHKEPADFDKLKTAEK